MVEFWTIVVVMMAIAFAVLWPFTKLFGELLTRQPPDVREWLHRFLSISVLRPQIAIASSFIVIPTSSGITSAPYYRGEQLSGSQTTSYYSTRIIDKSAAKFVMPTAA